MLIGHLTEKERDNERQVVETRWRGSDEELWKQHFVTEKRMSRQRMSSRTHESAPLLTRTVPQNLVSIKHHVEPLTDPQLQYS